MTDIPWYQLKVPIVHKETFTAFTCLYISKLFLNRNMDAVSMFQTPVSKLVFKWKRFVSKPGAWLAWGWQLGKQTNPGKKGLLPAEKQTFLRPGKRLVSGSRNKGFEPQKVCVPAGNKTLQRPATKTKVSKL